MNSKDVDNNLPVNKPRPFQLDLFSHFITNDKDAVSNTIETWETIPKYFITPNKAQRLRNKDGYADPYKLEFLRDGVPCSVEIQPALIKEGARYKAYFPSVTEEIIEEVLKKILVDQHYGFHEVKELKTYVRFTLRMIHKELKENGKSRSIKEIKKAIDIMSSCTLTYCEHGEEVWRGTILQDLVTVGRDKYLADNDSHHAARLPIFISHAINKGEYRQFEYSKYLTCTGQLSRWVYKQMINRFRQASYTNTYKFLLSKLENSGLLEQKARSDRRKKVEDAFKELADKQVILNYTKKEVKEGRRLVDVVFEVTAHPIFVSEQKAANMRNTEIQNKRKSLK